MLPYPCRRIITGLLLGLSLVVGRSEPNTEPLFRNHGLPSGSSMEVLPQGAIVHVQLSNPYQTVANLEGLAKTLIPLDAVPPDAQQLLQSEHPLLTLFGMQTIQAPLTEENVAENFGLASKKPLSLSLYMGDPRRMFVVSIPSTNLPALGGFLKNILQVKSVEEITLADKPAIRMALSKTNIMNELYVVCSDQAAFICGDRSMAIALHNTPVAQRLNQDLFMRRVSEKLAGQDIGILFNPGLLKTFLVQAQQFRTLAVPMIQAQRVQLLKQIKPEVKAQIELQLRQQFGIRDIDEFADYAECVVVATYLAGGDVLSKELIAFEGVCITASLDPKYPQINAMVYSQDFQPDQYTKPLPLKEVRDAIQWFGQHTKHFSAKGKQPLPHASTFCAAWLKQLKTTMDTKGLTSPLLDKYQEMLAHQPQSQPLQTKAPWILTAYVPLNPAPRIDDFQSLDAYLKALSKQSPFPLFSPVKIIPGQGLDFLDASFKESTQISNEQEKLSRDFWQDVTGKTGWLDHNNRYSTGDLPGGLKKYTLESAYTTHSGLFGYDQHEWVNRSTFAARALEGYLVYHQGTRNIDWLANLDKTRKPGLTPAVSKLLDRLPQDVNYFSLKQPLAYLPGIVNWLAGMEKLAHNDLEAYLAKAREIQQKTSDPKDLEKQLAALKIPGLVSSLNRDETTGEFYCLLPGGATFPRAKMAPVLQTLIADYASKASQFGGRMVYSRVQPGVYEVSIVHNTEGIAALISSVFNGMKNNYLNSPENMQKLQQTFSAPRDSDLERIDQILVRNPAWQFLPGPKGLPMVKKVKSIPQRATNAPATTLDLSAYYNGNLDKVWQSGGLANNTLKELPQGIQELGGTPFDIRGVIQLSGKSALNQLSVKFPKEVKGIKIQRKGAHIQILHATAYTAPDGTKIGAFTVQYADGQNREIPIVYGQDVRDWWTQSDEPKEDKPVVAWTGKNPTNIENGGNIRLFKTTWTNPLPDVEIKSIDYTTAMSPSAPFLIAITVD